MLKLFQGRRKNYTHKESRERQHAESKVRDSELGRALRSRYRQIDIEVSEALGEKFSNVDELPISEVVGSLIALRLVGAGERLGLSSLPEGRDGIRLAGLTACAIYASYCAKSASDRSDPALALDLDGLRDGALSPVAVRSALLGDEWRSEISDLINRALKGLFTEVASQSGNSGKFRNAVSSLGVLEVRAFEKGAEEDIQQDHLAEAIGKMLFSMV